MTNFVEILKQKIYNLENIENNELLERLKKEFNLQDNYVLSELNPFTIEYLKNICDCIETNLPSTFILKNAHLAIESGIKDPILLKAIENKIIHFI